MIKLYGLKPFMPELKGVVRDVRVLWTLEEVGLDYEHIVLDAATKQHKTPSYMALNPFGKVPTIDDDGFVLFESPAICAYLGDKTGQLTPKPGTRERALFDQWMSFASNTFEPNVARVVKFDWFTDKKDMDATRKTLRAESLTIATDLLKTVDEQLAKRPYLTGQTFTVADIIFSSICRYALHTEITANTPRVNEYLRNNFARPAFQRALKKHSA